MASPRKFLLLAKTEVTQFTDPTPTAGANSILIRNEPKFSPLEIETEDRNLIRSYYGSSEKIPVKEESVVEFDVDIAGSGTPLGTAAAYGPLLKACDFVETLTPTTKTEYTLVSGTGSSMTFYGYRDGILYKMTGCRGTVQLNFAAKRLPFFHFRFLGKYTPVSDAAIASGADFSAFKTPVASIPAKMGTVTLDGYAAKLSEFTCDLANQVDHAVWMNNETLLINDRKPTGRLSVELVTVASKDYWSLVRNVTPCALVVTQGVVAGNIVAVTAPAVTLSKVSESTFENTLCLQFDASFNPSSGNDEIKITLT